MFKNPVVINSADHSRVRFTPADDFGFAQGIAHAPVLAFELEEMAKHFPIVFENKSGLPMMLFGLTKGSNLYLTEENLWRVPVVPAALSNYPFGLSRQGDDYMVIMDEAAETLQASRGKLLYNKKGEGFRPSPMLKALKERLQAIEQNRLVSNSAFATLSAQGVLVEREFVYKVGTEEQRLGGFSIIDWDKVQQLDASVRQQWESSGLLRLMQAQADSLQNLRVLHDLFKRRH